MIARTPGPCPLGCTAECKAELHGCRSECPALPIRAVDDLLAALKVAEATLTRLDSALVDARAVITKVTT